jgi:hypothetical protein
VPLPVRSAVFGNVGSLISFRVGNSDAEVLQREFGKTYAQETFASLDRFEIIARLSADGQTREAFRAQTLPPIEHQVGRREKLIARSREKYAAKRTDVEAKIDRWLTGHAGNPHRIHKGRIPFLSVRI